MLRRQERGGCRSAREAPFLEGADSRPSAGDLASPSGLHQYGITVAGQLRFAHRIRCGGSPARYPNRDGTPPLPAGTRPHQIDVEKCIYQLTMAFRQANEDHTDTRRYIFLPRFACIRSGDPVQALGVPRGSVTTSVEDLVIIGAGPSGLAAANAAAHLDPLVIDAGPAQHQRMHLSPATATQGVGGAGLFSDGKFSFWPSGTRLWQLDPDLLRQAYDWFRTQLSLFHEPVPPLPDASAIDRRQAGEVHEKRYPSMHSTFEDRATMISRLSAPIRRLTTGVHVSDLRREEKEWRLRSTDGTIRARKVLLATGRYGPLLMREVLPSHALRFLRLELGVRIEQDASDFFLANHPQLDPKYLWRDDPHGVEWRTFCCCRDGLVVWTGFQDIHAASGRADCPPTGRSNIGFNVRFVRPVEATAIWAHFVRTAARLHQPVITQLEDFINAVARDTTDPMREALGSIAEARLAQGLCRLMQDFPKGRFKGATLIGPTLEGVGWYPIHDDFLYTQLPGLGVAGDAVGSFRGLTAALVSGYVAGLALSRRR